jgi:hypothetical protein
VQQLGDAWPGVGLQGLGGALQPPLAFVKLARPDQVGGQRDQRGRDHGLGAPAVPLGQRDRFVAALPGGGERADPRREPELGEAADFEIGPADLPGQGGALLEVAFGVWQPQGPRLKGAQVVQRHCPQVAAERDVFVGLPGDWGVKEPGLFDDAGQVAAAPRQPQLERRDGQPEAALAIWWRRLDVRLGDGQVGGRLVQVAVEQVVGGADQGELGVIGGGSLGEGPHQRLDGLRLPVQGQAEGMVGQ